MQHNSVQSMLHMLLLTASAVVVCLLQPGLSNAASPKVDVCHREGDGSYHLITVAYQAVNTHLNHGDALPSHPVPGDPGARFDDTCAQVAASLCPCDFSLAGLAAVGIDGSDDEGLGCYAGRTSHDIIVTHLRTRTGEQSEASTGASYCRTLVVNEARPQERRIIEVTPLTEPQITACATDLRDVALELGANPRCP
jgi:hypothetical protein